ncbi:MAG: hypothetical protein M1147_09630 [Nitrospirae bacterium]|nr:hypothetical protein [Nitrospirota bacterium]MCL5978356.1 hypothetical protein [Nitrospirota bacterium]
MIPIAFINHAADILGATASGLSGSNIAAHCVSYAIEFNVDIPYPNYPFPKELPNKRTALRDNLKAFSPEQQFKIIKDLCELAQFRENKDVRDLKIKLITRYGHFGSAGQSEDINEALIEETKHWLSDYPESLKLYQEALTKFESKLFQRNLLDDLRLSLEKLLQEILGNNKSLENQLSEIGGFIKERKGSKELNNMFVKLIDYYSKYNNTYVKHDDAVIENEIEIIFEMTCSFMKFVIRIK